ncbi:MAG: hypothetical protein AB8G18_01130 [Gammaproteobacteria bacterium]
MKLSVFVFSLVLFQAGASEMPFIHDIPDFTQTHVIGKSRGNGQQYCAPTAVSNSLVWMSGGEISQLALIKKLASKRYMNTSLKNGTGTTGVLRGVERISEELFGRYKELTYEGWRVHPKSYSSGLKRPDIAKMKSYISAKSTAWINVGWYKYNKKNDEYQRIGGHWVTLVGAKGNQLILHDPAPRAGQTFSNEFVTFSEVKTGTLTGEKTGLPADARGYYSLGKGMHIKSRADVALIDGVVYFKI